MELSPELQAVVERRKNYERVTVERYKGAIQRIKEVAGMMRIPVDPTDPDIVMCDLYCDLENAKLDLDRLIRAVTLMACGHPRMCQVSCKWCAEGRAKVEMDYDEEDCFVPKIGSGRWMHLKFREGYQLEMIGYCCEPPYCSLCRTQQEAVAAAEVADTLASEPSKVRDENDVPLEGAVLRREYVAMRTELSTLQTRMAGLVLTTRDVMKLIDDGYLIRDISKDHERDWAIRQMTAVALLAKWVQHTDELAAALSVGDGAK